MPRNPNFDVETWDALIDAAFEEDKRNPYFGQTAEKEPEPEEKSDDESPDRA